MLNETDLKKAVKIIKKWCEENNIEEFGGYDPDKTYFHCLDDSIQIQFTTAVPNDKDIKYCVTINNGVGFNVTEWKWGTNTTAEGISKYQQWTYQYSPINELNIDSFIVIQSWFNQNTNFSKFPNIREILIYGE